MEANRKKTEGAIVVFYSDSQTMGLCFWIGPGNNICFQVGL